MHQETDVPGPLGTLKTDRENLLKHGFDSCVRGKVPCVLAGGIYPARTKEEAVLCCGGQERQVLADQTIGCSLWRSARKTGEEAKRMLEIISVGGRQDDWGNYSLCPYCWHEGKPSCKNVKYGFCHGYDPRSKLSSGELEDQIRKHLGASPRSGENGSNDQMAA